jgi:hypothetical protein
MKISARDLFKKNRVHFFLPGAAEPVLHPLPASTAHGDIGHIVF